jgi:hypothetical protein
MSRVRNKSVRCDWCGKLSGNQNGEYRKWDETAGYIHQPEWERFPGGDPQQTSIQSENDICEECAAGLCPACGSSEIVSVSPAIPGPDGWGGRCKQCGFNWAM